MSTVTAEQIEAGPRAVDARRTSRAILDSRVATERLLTSGHTRVLCVVGSHDRLRRAHLLGWRLAMTAAGLRPGEPLLADGSATGGYAAGLEIAWHYDVTAVVVADEELGAGVERALVECGRDTVVVGPERGAR